MASDVNDTAALDKIPADLWNIKARNALYHLQFRNRAATVSSLARSLPRWVVFQLPTAETCGWRRHPHRWHPRQRIILAPIDLSAAAVQS